jgi:hypothetical protein
MCKEGKRKEKKEIKTMLRGKSCPCLSANNGVLLASK